MLGRGLCVSKSEEDYRHHEKTGALDDAGNNDPDQTAKDLSEDGKRKHQHQHTGDQSASAIKSIQELAHVQKEASRRRTCRLASPRIPTGDP